ncbi:adenylate kinase-domain-containing protein [Trametes meyenii]|nr:adenylate kinase-domain-containing protein [Trametes meyenii]
MSLCRASQNSLGARHTPSPSGRIRSCVEALSSPLLRRRPQRPRLRLGSACRRARGTDLHSVSSFAAPQTHKNARSLEDPAQFRAPCRSFTPAARPMSSLPGTLYAFLRPTSAASWLRTAAPAVTGCSRHAAAPTAGTPGTRRAISQSAAPHQARPFSLNTTRSKTAPAAQDASGEGKLLRMIMFGKPGAGKGTLSGRLVKKYDVVSMSTGDLLRQHIAEKTEVGLLAESIVASGGLLPDDVMLKVVTSKLDLLQNRHWILDGFPRTLGQGQLLDRHLTTKATPLSLVVNLDVPDDVILGRISDRWVHLPSGRVYNLSYNPPKVAGHDDETGEPLTKRPDDNPETFARRLEQFYASTSPLLAYYGAQAAGSAATARLVTLSGSTSDEIWPQLEDVLRSHFPGVRERQEVKRRNSLSDALLAQRERDQRAEGDAPVRIPLRNV